MHRRLTDGPCPCQSILGGDGCTTIAAQGSAIGRVAAEHYFEEVLKGARFIEAQCLKSIMFE